jgi:hypothetical protein
MLADAAGIRRHISAAPAHAVTAQPSRCARGTAELRHGGQRQLLSVFYLNRHQKKRHLSYTDKCLS